MFRSERMNLFELNLAEESAWQFFDAVGFIKNMHIVNLYEHEPLSHRPYFHRISDIDKAEQKLDYIEALCRKFKKDITYTEDCTEFLEELTRRNKIREEIDKKSAHTLFQEVEELIHKKQREIQEQMIHFDLLEKDRLNRCEYFNLIKTIKPLLPDDLSPYLNMEADDENVSKMGAVQFYYLSGIINTSDIARFQKLIFRVSRGNVFLQTTNLIVDPHKTEFLIPDYVGKSVYFIVFQISSSQILKQRILKIVETSQTTPYKLPNNMRSCDELLGKLENEILDMNAVVKRTVTNIEENLSIFLTVKSNSTISYLEELRIILYKERCIINAINKMKLENKVFFGQVWVPMEETNYVKRFLKDLKSNNPLLKADLVFVDFNKSELSPPSHIKTTEFTNAFQLIVSTYGIPKYREVNPGLFTMISFPFEFGIMFGDIGHGGLIFLLGIFLWKYKEQISKTGFKDVLFLRYLILFMGFFAFYCGIIYNEFFAIPWNLFGSCYSRNEHNEFIKDSSDCTYIAGIDPVWFQSSAEIVSINSFKMKLSIIVGVSHMILGIALKGINALHFDSYIDFFFEFLPQFIFFLSTFGYMSLAIIIKWLIRWEDVSKAPSIIAIFINLGYTLPGTALYGDSEGIFQTKVQQTLFLIAFICVFLMLLPKPILMFLKHKKSTQQEIHGEKTEELKVNLLENNDKKAPQAKHHSEEHDLSDLFVHQMIETIEFVLGSISNTASYLRLWALSLAHGQLAKVFLDMTVLGQLKSGGILMAVIGFPIFLSSSFGVLMCMDVMECFLHTLRLHWVEFQNKFYKGGGTKFDGFDTIAQINEEMAHKKELRKTE